MCDFLFNNCILCQMSKAILPLSLKILAKLVFVTIDICPNNCVIRLQWFQDTLYLLWLSTCSEILNLCVCLLIHLFLFWTLSWVTIQWILNLERKPLFLFRLLHIHWLIIKSWLWNIQILNALIWIGFETIYLKDKSFASRWIFYFQFTIVNDSDPFLFQYCFPDFSLILIWV